MQEAKVFRYLKFRSKRGLVRGLSICKHLGIQFQRLPDLDEHVGIGSFGPAGFHPKGRHLWGRFARWNSYMATFRHFFRYAGKLRCIKHRDFRKGCNRPKRNSGINSALPPAK